LFQVVEDHEGVAIAYGAPHNIQWFRREIALRVERRGDRRNDKRRISDDSELHEPCLAGLPPTAIGDCSRQARLADPTGAGDRDEPGLTEMGFDELELVAPADERIELGSSPRYALSHLASCR
jgi:hypothetical protein